jgi:hypothetical protein
MLPQTSVIVLTSATGKFNYLSTRITLVGYKTFKQATPINRKNIAENPSKFKQTLKDIPECTFILYIGGILQYLVYEYANKEI